MFPHKFSLIRESSLGKGGALHLAGEEGDPVTNELGGGPLPGLVIGHHHRLFGKVVTDQHRASMGQTEQHN